MSLKARLNYSLHGWIKGTKCMCNQLITRVISIKLRDLINLNTQQVATHSSMHIVQLCFCTLVSLPGRLPLIMIMIKIQGKATACKPNQQLHTSSVAFQRIMPVYVSWRCLFNKLRLTISYFLLFTQRIIQRIHRLTWPDHFQFSAELEYCLQYNMIQLNSNS